MDHPCSCTLEIEMSDHDTAVNAARSLELDNAGYIEAHVSGATIVARASAGDLMSLRHTVDDYLACLSVALESQAGMERRRGAPD